LLWLRWRFFSLFAVPSAKGIKAIGHEGRQYHTDRSVKYERYPQHSVKNNDDASVVLKIVEKLVARPSEALESMQARKAT
jgi:hypothetical protein